MRINCKKRNEHKITQRHILWKAMGKTSSRSQYIYVQNVNVVLGLLQFKNYTMFWCVSSIQHTSLGCTVWNWNYILKAHTNTCTYTRTHGSEHFDIGKMANIYIRTLQHSCWNMKKNEAELRKTPIRESETAAVQRIFPILIQILFFHSLYRQANGLAK